MNAPPGDFRHLFVVCLGSFNPKILQPSWLAQYKLITEDESKSSTIHVISEQVANFDIQGVKIQCVNNHLTITAESSSRFDMLHDLVVGIFTLLPHTPVTAIGLNPSAHFPTPSENAWHEIGNKLAPKEDVWNGLFEMPGMQSLTILTQRSGAYPGPTRVTVEPSMKLRNGVYVGVNYHYDIPPGDGVNKVLDFIAADWEAASDQVDRVAAKIFEKLLP